MNDVTMNRRSFVKTAGALGALAAAGGAISAEGSLFGESSIAHADTEEQTVWQHCGVNCGGACALQCHVKDGAIEYVESDNTGSSDMNSVQVRACLRGRSIRRWLQSPDRLNYPMKRVAGTKRGEGKYERISWDEALDTIASEMKRIRSTYGDTAMYIHYASGVSSGIIAGTPVNRLFNLTGGYLKTYGSYSSAQISAAGTYTYGGGSYGSSFLTLQDNELVVMFGNSPADTRMGGGGHTWDFARMREAKNLRVICIDPRMSDTVCGQGGEWIPIVPGTDGALCAALAYQWITNDQVDTEFLHKYCVGYDEETLPEDAKGKNASYKDYILGNGADKTAKTPAWASAITKIPEQRIIELADEMAKADPVYICQGYGVERHSNGENAARCIMVLPQLLGQIGKPGTNDGRREGCNSIQAIATFPAGKNPVPDTISFYTWPDAIDHGEQMTATNAGVQGVEKLSNSIKFLFNYGGNALTNQHSDINATHELLQDESKCEFIVTSEVFMTDSAKYSDIILPDLAVQEQLDISKGGYADNDEVLFFCDPVYEPVGERRGIYEVCTDLAERLGVKDQFTEGKTREEWLRSLYEQAREKDSTLPTWEEGFKMGVYKRDTKPKLSLEKFVADPEANPLPTESGKIQIYSEKLAKFAQTWELNDGDKITALPEFDPAFDSYLDVSEEYPLLLMGFHYKAHVHSSYSNNSVLQTAALHQLWINPEDAQTRGISTGDMVSVKTERGEVRIMAKVTNRVIPGTVVMPQGMWHDADMDGDRIDKGGCINTLTRYRPTALAKANPQHSNVAQVEKVSE